MPILVDLPREDVDYNVDWVTKLHTAIFSDSGVGYLNLTESWKGDFSGLQDILRDSVHANERGHDFYFEKIKAYLEKFDVDRKLDFPDLFYDLPEVSELLKINEVKDHCEDVHSTYFFSRGGYANEYIVLDENESATVCVTQDGWFISGFSYLVGPSTGQLEIVFDDSRTMKLTAYDEYCYYTRLSARKFQFLSKKMMITQTAEHMSISLRKGERFEGRRTGYIGELYLVHEKIEVVKKNIMKSIDEYINL